MKYPSTRHGFCLLPVFNIRGIGLLWLSQTWRILDRDPAGPLSMLIWKGKFWIPGGFNPSEKYEFVSWGYEFSNIWKVIKFHGSSHQQPNFNGIFHCHPAMGVPPWLWKSMGNPRRDGFVKAWPNSLRGTPHFWTHLYIYIHLYTYIYICMYNIYMYILSIITWSR